MWYYDHLASMMDVVMITEDQEAVQQYGSLHPGVYVISMQVWDSPTHALTIGCSACVCVVA